jgi:hypothetical protein
MKLMKVRLPRLGPSLIHFFFLDFGIVLVSSMAPMDFWSNLDAELTARSTWMPNIDSLDFVNDPVTNGPYHRQHPDQ